MAWLQPQLTRERPDTFKQTVVVGSSPKLATAGRPYISLDDVLQHLLVERQIRDDPLELAILLLELLKAAASRRASDHRTSCASLIPAFLHTSATDAPSSACRNTNAICCSLNRDFFMENPSPDQDG
jgi:hypothetical protein